jgi:hypothetical protein
LARGNFDVHTFELGASEMRAEVLERMGEEQHYVSLRQELFALCPHPPEQIYEDDNGVTSCRCCYTTLQEMGPMDEKQQRLLGGCGPS